VSSAAYRRHVPRQWVGVVSAALTAGAGKGLRVRMGAYHVNAKTADSARALAIAKAKAAMLTPGRWGRWHASVRLANR